MSTAQYSDPSIADWSRVASERVPSTISWCGLCAGSFFLAEANGVTMPFVNTFLIDQGWSYEGIGSTVSVAGVVSWSMNIPIGLLIDAARGHRKYLLAGASLVVGVCIGLLPVFASSVLAVGVLLSVAALGMPFFGPLTNALTLQLVGFPRVDRAVGFMQSWNHAGNIAAALAAIAILSRCSADAVFYSAAVASILAAGSVLLIRSIEPGDQKNLDQELAGVRPLVGLQTLLRHRHVAPLLISTVLFHLANAPVMPLVAQKVRSVGGSNVQVVGVVLLAQLVMIPVAILAGLLGPRVGYKRLLTVGFLVLPIRIALYAFVNRASDLVALQALDGIGAGIFDVTSIAICAAIARERGQFNGLMGILGTAAGIGGVAGPFISGVVVQHAGFTPAFWMFAAIAACAAFVFVVWMPSDRTDDLKLSIPT